MADDSSEVERRFEEILSGAGLIGGWYERPELRHASPEEPVLLQLRMDLVGAAPPIWRRMQVWSDVPLDSLHHLIQIAFDWDGQHLYRFALGGDPFDRGSQIFLCPQDRIDPDGFSRNSVGVWMVQLDETVRTPGDVLHYVYDYGDNWSVRILLEEVLPADEDIEVARIVGGERAAPPEDSGGIRTAEELARVLPDPSAFEPDRLNAAIAEAVAAEPPDLGDAGRVPLRLIEIGIALEQLGLGEGYKSCISELITDDRVLDEEGFAAATTGIRWFLDRAVDGGIPLTAAGYMKPDDVVAASEVVPMVLREHGKHNRERNEPGILQLREALEELGLLRTEGQRVRLTELGARAQRGPGELREALIGLLIPREPGFEQDAVMLLLLYAVVQREHLDVKALADTLTLLGHRTDGEPIRWQELRVLSVEDILRNVNPGQHQWRRGRSREASMFAREVLLGSGFGMPSVDGSGSETA